VAVLVGVSVYAFYLAYRKYAKDTSNIISEIDRLVFFHACAQTAILLFFFVIAKSSILMYLVRVLRFGQEIIVFYLVGVIWAPPDREDVIKKAAIGLYIANFLLLLGSGYNMDLAHAYECTRIVWILFPFASLALALASAFLYYDLVERGKKMPALNDYHAMAGDGPPSEGKESGGRRERFILPLLNKDWMTRNRRQLPILITGDVLSALIQASWCCYAFFSAETTEECAIYAQNPEGFGAAFLLLLVKIISWLLPPWTIYYGFYFKNKSYFTTIQAGEKGSGEEDPFGRDDLG
jgi:hypothetical protein